MATVHNHSELFLDGDETGVGDCARMRTERAKWQGPHGAQQNRP